MKKIIMLFILIGILGACGKQKVSNQEKEIQNIYDEAVQNYEIIGDEGEEGYTVRVNAPDLIAIYGEISGNSSETDIEIDKKIIEEYPYLEKEYVFNVSEKENESIKEAFLQQMTWELMCEAIKQTVFTEEWSAEESMYNIICCFTIVW